MYRDEERSTESEWDRADARQRGEENPEAAWVLSDRDVWHRNPFYRGPAVPHPELDAFCPPDLPCVDPRPLWLQARDADGEDELPF